MTESTLRPYTSSWEHLHAELGYLDLLLGQEVLRSRRTLPKDQPAILRGLVISESEVEHLLDGISRPPVVVATAKAGACRHEIEGRKRASLEHGVYLALPRLTHLFGLTPFEEQAALICLAPELDLRYGRLYAYLQDDATRTQPSGELVMRLLCATPDERLPARRSLSPQAPLLRAHILRPFGGEEQPLLARPLKMDELVVNHLLGVGGASQDLVGAFDW